MRESCVPCPWNTDPPIYKKMQLKNKMPPINETVVMGEDFQFESNHGKNYFSYEDNMAQNIAPWLKCVLVKKCYFLGITYALIILKIITLANIGSVLNLPLLNKDNAQPNCLFFVSKNDSFIFILY